MQHISSSRILYACVSGNIAVLLLEILEQSCDFVNFTTNWQHAGAELAVCTAHIVGHQAGPRALLHALRHYTLRAKTKLVGFNLGVSTLTTKPPNLIPRQIFQLCGMVRWLCPMCVFWLYRFIALQPGDVVLTGTPPGVGCFRKPPLWLKVRTIRSTSTPIIINHPHSRLSSLILRISSWEGGGVSYFSSKHRTEATSRLVSIARRATVNGFVYRPHCSCW